MEISEPIYFDLETTGFNPKKDKVVSMSLIDFKMTVDMLFNPEIPILNSDIHGITDDMVRGMPTFEQYYEVVEGMFKGRTIIAYNLSFDQRFCPDKLAGAGELICAMRVYEKMTGRRFKLFEACENEGIEIDKTKLHNANYDVEILKKLWGKIGPKTEKLDTSKLLDH